ncbi:hypothetical protein [Streptomyces sp. VRA16 Mangrove soil]|uniref:hypothetical protein n=1 Tax=Streptomyces sp. VRA16 Mangrove soil TaxID=2817434 RepID=UPI001A9D8A9C|nr:hypothetical protein [Streptomyces sp. VRA16 Mangrove soil]MBO1337502.1 hypothetical protein [Streptomyces sp. VRA16 Mangrove soil]
MSDQFPQPEVMQSAAPEPTGPVRPRRRWPAAAGACVLALAVVGGGVVYTAVQVHDADRTVSTKVWGKPKQPKERSARSGQSDLEKRLLPVPDGYLPGPDIDEFGNDKAITGKEAVARFKKSADDLPSRQRDAQHRSIDKLKLKGLAVRSYSAESDDLVVETQLAEIQNRQAGRDLKAFQSEFLRALGVFTKGPKVKGHRNADCFLAPRDSDTKLDMLVCSAYEDDLLVSVTAYGPKSLDSKAVATLLAQQLDHISSRGELV